MGEKRPARTERGESQDCSLSAQEQETWMALKFLITGLPTLFDTQLRRESDLSLLEFTVMASLSSRPDGTARLSELAAEGNCERSRLSHLLSRLEGRGFVTRAADPFDKRHALATLTQAGELHLADAVPGHIRLVRSSVLHRLSPEEQASLRNVARRVLEPPASADQRR